jgi:hypothetical protein
LNPFDIWREIETAYNERECTLVIRDEKAESKYGKKTGFVISG